MAQPPGLSVATPDDFPMFSTSGEDDSVALKSVIVATDSVPIVATESMVAASLVSAEPFSVARPEQVL